MHTHLPTPPTDARASDSRACRKHAAVIYNPVAVPAERLRALVDAAEALQGWEPSEWFATTEGDPGGGPARAALLSEPDVILVAGGDGTVRAVADVVQSSGVALALVPVGTGNLLARNLGLALADPEESVRAAFGGVARDVDVATADLEHEDGSRSCHAFMVMAGIGLDVQMAETTNAVAKRHLGWLAYLVPIVRSILSNRQFPMRYSIDGDTPRPARAHTVIVGNCGTLTANVLLLPDAVIDDGLLDVVVLRPKGFLGWGRVGTRITLQGILHRSSLGRSVLQATPDLRALNYARGRDIHVEFRTPQRAELDGDSFGAVTSARISVKPGALRVCVPAL